MLGIVLGVLLAIDPGHSSAQFSVEHIFVERVSGSVPIAGGSVELPSGSMIPTVVDAELDATRLHTDDADRDASLRSPDWFDTKAFPTWRFSSTKIVASPTGFTMQGTLTIHGVAQPQTVNVTVTGSPEHPRYHAVCHVDRHAFGMKSNRLDPVIGNPVDVTIDITLRS